MIVIHQIKSTKVVSIGVAILVTLENIDFLISTYHYNLELLKKSRDFGTTEIGWDFCYVYKSIRKCGDFLFRSVSLCLWPANTKLLFYVILQLRAEPVCRDVPIAYEDWEALMWMIFC